MAATLGASAFADTFTLRPASEAESKETKIYDQVGSSNFSSNIDVFGPGSGADFQSLLQFDLAGTFAAIPSAQKIKSAKIILNSSGYTPYPGDNPETPEVETYPAEFGSGMVAFFAITSPWRETAGSPGTDPLATYNAFYGPSPTITVGGLSALREVTVAGKYDWDVTTLVKAWKSGALANNGVLIKQLNGFSVGLSDVDSAGAANAPQITIVADLTGPVIPSIGSVALIAGRNGKAILPSLTAGVAITDDYDAPQAIAIQQSTAAGTELSVGTQTITITATDTVGNASTQDVTVTVIDADGILASATGTTITAGGTLELPPGYTPPAGAVLGTFYAPAISDNSDLAARVDLAVGKKKFPAIYSQTFDGTQKLVAVQGSAAFGGSTFKSFLDPILAPDGSIAFAATVQGGGVTAAEDQGVWTDVFGGGLEPVLLEGNPIEGLVDGFAQPVLKSVISLAIRDRQLIALVTFAPGKAGVNAGNDTALIRVNGPGAGTILLREGVDLAFPSLAVSPIKDIAILRPALGSNGQSRYYSNDGFAVAKVTRKDGVNVLVRIDVNMVAAIPTLATGSASDVATGAKWDKFGLPAISGVGEKYAFLGTVQKLPNTITAANDAHIAYSPDGTNFTTVAHEGGDAPLAGGNTAKYVSFLDPVVNDAGVIAYQATIKGTGVTAASKTGLWAGTSGNLSLVARAGETATGTDGLALLSGSAWSAFPSYALPDGDGAGLIFQGTLKGGGVTAKDNSGVWAVDSTGTKLLLIVRTGTPGLHPDPTKSAQKITALSLLTATPGSYGTARSYNSFGTIAVAATFEDKSQAVLRLNIP